MRRCQRTLDEAHLLEELRLALRFVVEVQTLTQLFADVEDRLQVSLSIVETMDPLAAVTSTPVPLDLNGSVVKVLLPSLRGRLH